MPTRRSGILSSTRPLSAPCRRRRSISALDDAEMNHPLHENVGKRNGQERPVANPPIESISGQPERWFSKCGVQASVVKYLIQTSWHIRWVGDCLARDRFKAVRLDRDGEPIHDLDAERDGLQLLVEVIGHPGADDSGDGRPTFPTQERGHAIARYSDALLSGPAMRRRHPGARFVQAFPAHGLYCTSVPRARAYGALSMRAGEAELWMVSKDGTVTERAQRPS